MSMKHLGALKEKCYCIIDFNSSDCVILNKKIFSSVFRVLKKKLIENRVGNAYPGYIGVCL